MRYGSFPSCPGYLSRQTLESYGIGECVHGIVALNMGKFVHDTLAFCVKFPINSVQGVHFTCKLRGAIFSARHMCFAGLSSNSSIPLHLLPPQIWLHPKIRCSPHRCTSLQLRSEILGVSGKCMRYFAARMPCMKKDVIWILQWPSCHTA